MINTKSAGRPKRDTRKGDLGNNSNYVRREAIKAAEIATINNEGKVSVIVNPRTTILCHANEVPMVMRKYGLV